jgi:hypothetical protein
MKSLIQAKKLFKSHDLKKKQAEKMKLKLNEVVIIGTANNCVTRYDTEKPCVSKNKNGFQKDDVCTGISVENHSLSKRTLTVKKRTTVHWLYINKSHDKASSEEQICTNFKFYKEDAGKFYYKCKLDTQCKKSQLHPVIHTFQLNYHY